MNRETGEHIRAAVAATRRLMPDLELDDCDRDDLNALADRVELEIEAHQPNPRTLAICLNSIARSLRADPRARSVCLELDAAMRDADIPTQWEH
jgi:hypothetical protein